jgi:uncharacterized protein YjbI with pentapeptide repeats
MTLLELLMEERVEEFNAQRGRRSTPDLFAADLADLNLRGADLSGANLEKADLSGSDLSQAILARANVSGADLTGARLDGAMAVKSNWREAYMDKASLEGADFTGSDLRDAVLNESTGSHVVFRGCRLRGVEAVKARFDGCDFGEAKLDKSDFTGSSLKSCTFTEASLAGASFESCVLSGSDMTSARAANTSFNKATMDNVRLERADLTAATLNDADLSGACLIEADLAEAEVAGALFRGADLSRARLDGVAMDSATEAVLTDETAATDSPTQIRFEDVSGAVLGDRIALRWENEDDEATLVERCAVLQGKSRFKGLAPALPVPAELTLARSIVALGEGFACTTMIERPSGTEVRVTLLDADGAVQSTLRADLEYEPAVTPVVTGGDALRIYGLGRRGPTLFGHELQDGEIVRLFAQRASTARALLGRDRPVLSTRGGVVQPLSPQGIEAPLTEPNGFSVRAASSVRIGDRCVLAWLPEEGRGLCWAELGGSGRPQTQLILKDQAITSVDLGALNGRVVLLFAREVMEALGACGAFALELDEAEAKPTELILDPVHDIDAVSVIGDGEDRIVVLGTTLGEDIVLLEYKDNGRGKVLQVLP